MKATKQLIIAALLTGTSAMAAEEGKPMVVDAAHESIVATVEDIDHEARTISLKGPAGNTVTMQVGPEVVRFNEIQKGDRIKADFLESVAVAVAPSGQTGAAPVASEKNFLVRNPESQKPGATAVKTDVITATVEEIDLKERIATLKTPDGNLREVSIAPDVPDLKNVKPGDRVVVETTRAVALGIQE